MKEKNKELKPLVKLINAREKRDLTQEKLAKIANISRPMLSHIERGAAVPSLLVAYRIAKALDSTIDEIFFEHNVQNMNIPA